MLLTQAMYESIIDSMINDTDFLAAPAVGVNSEIALALIVAPVAPGRQLSLGDITLMGTGRCAPDGAIRSGSKTQNVVVNVNGDRGIQLVEQLGGFSWKLIEPEPAPLDVYGVALVRLDDDDIPVDLLGSAMITPTRLSLAGQTIQVSSVIGYLTGFIFEMSTVVISSGGTVPA